jgi:hypothetical protein
VRRVHFRRRPIGGAFDTVRKAGYRAPRASSGASEADEPTARPYSPEPLAAWPPGRAPTSELALVPECPASVRLGARTASTTCETSASSVNAVAAGQFFARAERVRLACGRRG